MDHLSNLLNVIFILLVAWLTAYTAAKKGRSAIFWFFLGFLFNLFALLFLIFLPPVKKRTTPEREPSFQGTTIEVKPLATSEEPVDLQSPERQEWYYLDAQRQQTGPVTFEALKDLYRNATITDSTYLWCEGMKEWRKLSELNFTFP